MLLAAFTLSLLACAPGEPWVPSPVPATPPPVPVPSPSAPAPITVRGFVYDWLGPPLPGATIDLTAHTSGVAATDTSGAFAVSGTVMPGTSILVGVAAPGYESASRSVAANSPYVEFRLNPIDPIDLDGLQVLTIEASRSCADLPSVARRRTYDVTMSAHAGGRKSFTLELTGGTSFQNAVPLLAFTSRNYVSVPQIAWSDPDLGGVRPLIEPLDDGYVSIVGAARGSAAPGDSIALAFDGTIGHCPQPSTLIETAFDGRQVAVATCAVQEIACRSSDHRLTLARR